MSVPQWQSVPILSGRTARLLVECAAGALEVSLDLGLTRTEVTAGADLIQLPGGESVSRSALAEAFSAPEDCVTVSGGACRKSYTYSIATRRYYKLYQPFDGRAPTIVINNAAMHAIVGMDPWQDEEEKVGALGPLRGRCLDTCCGLGYSAQLLARTGCQRVTTCEVDEEVLRIASLNPWSRGLFQSGSIEILHVDVRDFVKECAVGTFAAIFHDPPTPYQAGELYSEELYAGFARALSPSGVLYHYVGRPGARRGQDYARGVMRRLQSVGFTRVSRCARGVLAHLRG